MSREIRSRRAGATRAQVHQPPLYARMLGLRHLTPSGLLCFTFFEGTVALGVLLALAELVSWWGVLVLPATVAVMVKLNDVIAGAITPPVAVAAHAAHTPLRQRSSSGLAASSAPVWTPPVGGAGAVHAQVARPWGARAEGFDPMQRARQTATRRYQ
ncbi:MAG TPA: hypothetical protein VFO77_16145 [Actinoplanes sp.]|nr:hypothetical protein [Actinoplanes sp.]